MARVKLFHSICHLSTVDMKMTPHIPLRLFSSSPYNQSLLSTSFHHAIPPSGLCGRRRVLVQNPLLHQLRRLRPLHQLLLQTVRPHMFLQLPLLSLNGGRGVGIRKDVPYTKKSQPADRISPYIRTRLSLRVYWTSWLEWIRSTPNHYVRSTNSSLSGLFSNPFLKLSLAC